MRNILTQILYRAKESFGSKLKLIWLQDSKKEAYQMAQTIIDEYGKKFPEAIEILQISL